MMTGERVRLYGEINKVERRDDGTVTISGVASSEAVDADGETITAAAMKAALPSYMRFPAIREMHQAIAAGRALSVTVGKDGRTYVEAHVVDRDAVAKVKAGVYRGFSIGGHVPPDGRDRTNPKKILRLSLTEISLVDRPANPEATFQLVKLDGARGEPAAKAGQTLPGYLRDALAALVDALDRKARETTSATERRRVTDLRDEIKAALNSESLPNHALAIQQPAGLTAPVDDGKHAAAGVSITKLTADRADALAKWMSAEGKLTKVEQRLVKAEGLVGTLTRERDDLAKRYEAASDELQKRPKGGLKAVPIGKGEDTGLPVREAEHDADDALSAIRKAHSRPMPMRLRSE
jgi:hypothetical protein